MLYFKVISEDGVKFEQLVREIFLKEGYEVHWTGVGSDGRRDLIVIETLTGPMSTFKRKWLVSCKHKAHSGKSVVLSDLTHFVADCAAINAEGFILAMSTYPASSVVNRLEETGKSNDIHTKFLDAIEIERRLMHPSTYGLIYTFFPVSSKDYKWNIYNANSPNLWAANYKSHFFYMTSRISNSFPFLQGIEEIVEVIDNIKVFKSKDYKFDSHLLQLRAVYFDDKNSTHYVYLDYLFPKSKDEKKPLSVVKLNDQLRTVFSKVQSKINEPTWDVNYMPTNFFSDYYDKNANEYYVPFMKNFLSGSARSEFLHDKVYHYNFLKKLKEHNDRLINKKDG